MALEGALVLTAQVGVVALTSALLRSQRLTPVSPHTVCESYGGPAARSLFFVAITSHRWGL